MLTLPGTRRLPTMLPRAGAAVLFVLLACISFKLWHWLPFLINLSRVENKAIAKHVTTP